MTNPPTDPPNLPPPNDPGAGQGHNPTHPPQEGWAQQQFGPGQQPRNPNAPQWQGPNQGAGQYPPQGGGPYPPQGGGPYPPQGGPYPPQGAGPYPGNGQFQGSSPAPSGGGNGKLLAIIAGAVAVVLVVVAAVVVAPVLISSVRDGVATPTVAPIPPTEEPTVATVEPTEDSVAPTPTTEDTSPAPSLTKDAGGDAAGTQEDPLSLGATIELEEWTVTVNDFVPDATEVVMEENSANGVPAEGNAYGLVNVTVKRNAADAAYPIRVNARFVTPDGDIVEMVDEIAIPPEDIGLLDEIGQGDEVTGNLALEMPVDGVGTFVVFDIYFEEDVYFFATS